jgi:hypothetical protein
MIIVEFTDSHLEGFSAKQEYDKACLLNDDWWKYSILDNDKVVGIVAVFYNGNDSYKVCSLINNNIQGVKVPKYLKRMFINGIKRVEARHVETFSKCRSLDAWHKFMGFKETGVEDGLIHWELNNGH